MICGGDLLTGGAVSDKDNQLVLAYFLNDLWRGFTDRRSGQRRCFDRFADFGLSFGVVVPGAFFARSRTSEEMPDADVLHGMRCALW